VPRVGPRRPLVAIRMSDEGIAYVDHMAITDGVVKPNGEPNRSEMIRILLREAIAARISGRPAKYRKKET
jgi:hypothetical protein